MVLHFFASTDELKVKEILQLCQELRTKHLDMNLEQQVSDKLTIDFSHQMFSY